MKIIISGGGIGGLTTALCLINSGHEVTVFERATKLLEAGAGIQCGANALSVLEHLGLLPQIKQLTVQPKKALFRDFESGEILHRLTLGEQYQQRYGAPYYHIHRADLQSVLVSNLRQRAEGVLQLDSQVQAFTEHPDHVQVALANGQIIEADCLIGADGIRSNIREKISPDLGPRFSGNVAWRLLVPRQHLPENWMDTVVSNFVGPGRHAILYYVRAKQAVNFVGVVEKPNKMSAANQSWVEKGPWSELKADFEGWHDCIQQLIEVADRDNCYRWDLYDQPPLKSWVSSRVALLGDAAHATLPFMASGAAMAIEDARVLDRALSEKPDLAEALASYQRTRINRTTGIQRNSRRLGRLYHLESPFLRKLAFKGFGMASKRAERDLAQYNANTVALQ